MVRLLRTAWLVVAACVCNSGSALGQSAAASNSTDGLSVRAEWPSMNYSAGGYFPVQLEISSTRGPRELRIEVDNQSYPYGSRVSRRVALEANQPLRFVLPVPLTTQSMFGTIRIYERAVELDKLRLTGVGASGGFWQSGASNALLVGRAAPDWRTYERAVQNFITGSSNSNVVPPVIAPDKLTAQWIDYSVYDLVFVPLIDLEGMPAATREALFAWTMAGGNLLILGVKSADDAAALDRLLSNTPRSETHAEWRLPNLADRRPGTLLAQGASSSGNWPTEARHRLESRGLEAYQTYCTELLARHGSSLRSHNEMNTLAWTCVIGPDAVSDMAQVVRLAERASASDPRSYPIMNTLGVALYRAGRYPEAIQKLTRAMQLAPGAGGRESDWLFLAMAHHKLGQKEEAARWFAKAASGSSDPESRLFLREAETVLKSDGTEPPSTAARPAAKENATSDGKPVEPHFSVRDFGFGRIVRINSADPFPGTEEDWTWLFRTIGSDRLRWSDRVGMTARGGNPDFWNFLIPRVGRAPVLAFQVLIVVFALVIGPLNYFLLRKHKRLYLLLLTVPLFALITSGLLLGYAMASDGFAVRTRVRCLTYLDQVRGEGVAMSRISYYAGIAPAGGLRFSPDTAVYPMESEDGGRTYRTVDWTETQHLNNGWLQSRTPTQLVTVSYRQAGEQLAVAADSSGVVRVTNNLGCEVQTVVLCDESGRYYSGEKLAPGARALLNAQDNVDAACALIRLQIESQSLEMPEGLADRGGIRGGSILWGRRFMNRAPDSSWAVSILERTLEQLAGNSAQFQLAIRPRMYVAVTGRPTFVELGLADSEDAGSLYVIVGAY